MQASSAKKARTQRQPKLRPWLVKIRGKIVRHAFNYPSLLPFAKQQLLLTKLNGWFAVLTINTKFPTAKIFHSNWNLSFLLSLKVQQNLCQRVFFVYFDDASTSPHVGSVKHCKMRTSYLKWPFKWCCRRVSWSSLTPFQLRHHPPTLRSQAG